MNFGSSEWFCGRCGEFLEIRDLTLESDLNIEDELSFSAQSFDISFNSDTSSGGEQNAQGSPSQILPTITDLDYHNTFPRSPCAHGSGTNMPNPSSVNGGNSNSPATRSRFPMSSTPPLSNDTGISNSASIVSSETSAYTPASPTGSAFPTHTPRPARLIQRAAPRQTRRREPRVSCGDCGKSFSRLADLKRHQDDLHKLGQYLYVCNRDGCMYMRFARLDKMQEHCRVRRHGDYTRYDVHETVDG